MMMIKGDFIIWKTLTGHIIMDTVKLMEVFMLFKNQFGLELIETKDLVPSWVIISNTCTILEIIKFSCILTNKRFYHFVLDLFKFVLGFFILKFSIIM